MHGLDGKQRLPCPCTWTPAFTGDPLPEDLSFTEWLNEQDEKTQKDILGAGWHEEWRAGRLKSLTQRIDQRGRPITLGEFRRQVEGASGTKPPPTSAPPKPPKPTAASGGEKKTAAASGGSATPPTAPPKPPTGGEPPSGGGGEPPSKPPQSSEPVRREVGQLAPLLPKDERESERLRRHVEQRTSMQVSALPAAPRAAVKRAMEAVGVPSTVTPEDLPQYTTVRWNYLTTSDAALILQAAAFVEFDLRDAWTRWPHAPWENRFNAARAIFQREPAAARALVRSTYEATQRWLAERDIHFVTLYRGIRERDDPHGMNRDPFSHRPLTSFTTAFEMARYFGGEGTLLVARVPSDRVYSIASTGPGVAEESELVVLGGTDPAYRVATRMVQDEDALWAHIERVRGDAK